MLTGLCSRHSDQTFHMLAWSQNKSYCWHSHRGTDIAGTVTEVLTLLAQSQRYRHCWHSHRGTDIAGTVTGSLTLPGFEGWIVTADGTFKAKSWHTSVRSGSVPSSLKRLGLPELCSWCITGRYGCGFCSFKRWAASGLQKCTCPVVQDG